MACPHRALQDLGGTLLGPQLGSIPPPHPVAFPLPTDFLQLEHLGLLLPSPRSPPPKCPQLPNPHSGWGLTPEFQTPSHYPEIPALNPRGLPGHASDIPNLIRPSYLHLPFLGDCPQKTISQAISDSSLPSSSLLGAFVRTCP